MKKTSSIVVSSMLLLHISPVFAQTTLTAPTAPTAPTPPPQPTSAPEPTAPTAPTPPPNPTQITPTPTPTQESQTNESPTSESSAPSPTPTPSSDESQVAPPDAQTTSNSESSPTTTSGQVGSTSVNTGDANTNATGITTANTNTSTSVNSTPTGTSGVSVVNDNNGSNSSNTGSIQVVSDKTTVQNNNATVANNLNAASNSGSNDASRNVGDTAVRTGDANTSGTLITAVNTNVDAVAVAEFNVIDDHVGDIVLDFATGCLSGCGLFGSPLVANSGNGSNSTNSAEIDQQATKATFQNNEATIGNGMVLAADSGNNTADNNTGGDTTIYTGDANVAGNALTFANNNISGGVVYSTVNLFGSLVGDIIFPEEYLTAANTGNGTGSTNTATVEGSTAENTIQSNQANLGNNLVIDAQTGDNQTSDNTGGSNAVETGDTNVVAQVMNVANMNVVGDMWLVLVNEAGKWIGKIMGAEPGANYAGSDGMEFAVADDGTVSVTNQDNGSGSTNTAGLNNQQQTTTVQSNTAAVNNDLHLSANTGGNSASRNTGGDTRIVTGDANIVANIVNFVNNNISGGGRLFVTVVNVFDSWLGNFRGPGAKPEPETQPLADSSTTSPSPTPSPAPAIGGYVDESPTPTPSPEQGEEEVVYSTLGYYTISKAQPIRRNRQQSVAYFSQSGQVAGISTESESSIDPLLDQAYADAGTTASAKTRKKMKINLAWGLLFAPPLALALVVRRRLYH